MTTAFEILWAPISTTNVAAAQALTAATPLVMNTTQQVNNPFTGVNTPVFQMPNGNVRHVSLTSAGNPGGATTFTIIGEDERQNILTETTIAGALNANTIFSAKAYFKVYSVTPSATNAATVSLGMGGGYTFWYKGDVYNKANSYSMTYSHLNGAISITPQFTMDDPESWIADPTTGRKRTLLAAEIQAFTVPIPPTTQSVPSPLVIPVVATSSFSFVYPLVALNTLIPDTSVGGFKQSIVQQGGKY